MTNLADHCGNERPTVPEHRARNGIQSVWRILTPIFLQVRRPKVRPDPNSGEQDEKVQRNQVNTILTPRDGAKGGEGDHKYENVGHRCRSLREERVGEYSQSTMCETARQGIIETTRLKFETRGMGNRDNSLSRSRIDKSVWQAVSLFPLVGAPPGQQSCPGHPIVQMCVVPDAYFLLNS